MLVISSYHQSFWQADNSLPFTDTRFPRLLSIVQRFATRNESNVSTKRFIYLEEKKEKVSIDSRRLTRR